MSDHARYLFPPIEPFAHGRLAVGDGHELYWETCGNPDGQPVVFLHGGPGSGCSPLQRRFFDPGFWKIILFDQRGAGRSTPHADVNANTTPHLIADIEALRSHLGVDKWLVFGGSWGSTLALAYGEAHAERCLGFVLRGIFLCRRTEIDWFLYGLRAIFPEAWQSFSEYIPEPERGDLLAAYHRRLMDPDPDVHLPAADHWARYEARCSTLVPDPDLENSFASAPVALGLSRIEAHYFTHDIFLPENSLLDNVGRLRHLPAVIVQGRYDGVCPIVSANDLHRAWPEAFYEIVADAGHSAFEPGISRALVQATQAFKTLLDAPAQKAPRRRRPRHPAKAILSA
jgi:proline iminopeptidase